MLFSDLGSNPRPPVPFSQSSQAVVMLINLEAKFMPIFIRKPELRHVSYELSFVTLLFQITQLVSISYVLRRFLILFVQLEIQFLKELLDIVLEGLPQEYESLVNLVSMIIKFQSLSIGEIEFLIFYCWHKRFELKLYFLLFYFMWLLYYFYQCSNALPT